MKPKFHKMYKLRLFFISIFFHSCAYAHLKSKIKNKNNSQGGCATPLNVPKLGVSGVKDTVKTNKDLDIQLGRM